MPNEEIPLSSGNVAASVARRGNTVRKPWNEDTAAVHRFMSSLREKGIDLPEPLGRDEQGRQIIEYVPGTLAMDHGPLDLAQLCRVGGLVRSIHDASGDFPLGAAADWETVLPPTASDMVCHNDLAPWNFVMGERWVFIDWDGAGPSTRLWDLAYAVQTFALNDPIMPQDVASARLLAFIDGYGADRQLRELIPETLARRTAAMLELLRRSHEVGEEPWGSMYASGHGDHWAAVTDYLKANEDVWRAAMRSAGR